MELYYFKTTITEAQEKISSYKGLISANKEVYDAVHSRIYELSMEVSSTIRLIHDGKETYQNVPDKYSKCQIMDGLKKKALQLIEDNVILELMVDERKEEIQLLLAKMSSVINSKK